MRAWRSGRIFLLLTTAFIVLLGIMRASKLPGGPAIGLSQVGSLSVAWPILAGVFALAVGLLLWSFVRPVRAGMVLAWAGAILAWGGLGLALLARTKPPALATIKDLDDTHVANLATATSWVGLSLLAAELMLAGAAIASARAARRAAKTTRTTWAARIGLVGGVVVLLLVFDRIDRFTATSELGWLLIGMLGAIIALVTAATARTTRTRPEIARTALLAVGSVAIGVVAVGLVNADPSMALKVAVALAVPIGLTLGAAELRDAAAWKQAARSLAGPFGVLAVATVAALFVVRGALHEHTDIARFAALPAELRDVAHCPELVPTELVVLTSHEARIPGEGAIPLAERDRLAARIESLAPRGDVWLALDDGAGDVPFATVGQVLDVVARSRGARAAGMSAGQTAPLEGCAIRLVGTHENDLVCTDPLPLAGECVPIAQGEKVFHVDVHDAQSVDTSWTQDGQLITRKQTTLAGLAEHALSEWKAFGNHSYAIDPRMDVAALTIDAGLRVRDAMSALAAMRSVRRDWYTPGNRHVPNPTHAAFSVSVALATR